MALILQRLIQEPLLKQIVDAADAYSAGHGQTRRIGQHLVEASVSKLAY